MPAFYYYECPECAFSSVQASGFTGSEECPLCAGDSGHSNRMTMREARPEDKPEGHDARKVEARLKPPSDNLGTDDWHKRHVATLNELPLEVVPQPKKPLTPSELKALMEKMWNEKPARSYHKPAGWFDPNTAEAVLKGGFWKGEEGELWRRQTSTPKNTHYRRRRRRK